MSLFGSKRAYSAANEFTWQLNTVTRSNIDPLNTLELIWPSELIRHQTELIWCTCLQTEHEKHNEMSSFGMDMNSFGNEIILLNTLTSEARPTLVAAEGRRRQRAPLVGRRRHQARRQLDERRGVSRRRRRRGRRVRGGGALAGPAPCVAASMLEKASRR